MPFLVEFGHTWLRRLEPQQRSLWSWVTRLLQICGYSSPLSCHHHYMSSNTDKVASKQNFNTLPSYRVEVQEASKKSQLFSAAAAAAAAGSGWVALQLDAANNLNTLVRKHMLVLLQASTHCYRAQQHEPPVFCDLRGRKCTMNLY